MTAPIALAALMAITFGWLIIDLIRHHRRRQRWQRERTRIQRMQEREVAADNRPHTGNVEPYGRH